MNTGLSEAGVTSRWLLLTAKLRMVLFRTNSGRAWISALGPKGVRQLNDGSIHIAQARSIGMGMCMVNGTTVPGLSDHNGYTIKTIPPEWVGRQVAIYTCSEEKRQKGGRATEDQKSYVMRVREAGGIGLIVNDAAAAAAEVEAWEPPLPGQRKIPEQGSF